jgi:hypothetical protein
VSWRVAAGLALAAAVSLVPVGQLHAQQTAITSGRLVRVSRTDTVGIRAATVVLHRVGRGAQGPMDSARTGPRGEFSFRFSADTAVVYLLSSGYAGIEYFSTPIQATPVRPDTGLLLFVFDTSTTAPLHLTSRHIVISKPAADGTRAALEIVALENAGTLTRVGGGLDRPTWGARLPAGVLGFQVGQGDVSAEAMQVRHDSVLLFAPVAPGEKQLVYTYQLPAAPGTVRIPIGDSIGTLNVMLEEFDRTVRGDGLTRADSQRIENRSFRLWTGAVGPGAVVTIDFPGNRTAWLLPGLVGVVGVSLVVALLRVLRRRAPPVGGASVVLDALARLDALYAGREAEVGAHEWAAYQRDRARLKVEMAERLAGKQPPT